MLSRSAVPAKPASSKAASSMVPPGKSPLGKGAGKWSGDRSLADMDKLERRAFDKTSKQATDTDPKNLRPCKVPGCEVLDHWRRMGYFWVDTRSPEVRSRAGTTAEKEDVRGGDPGGHYEYTCVTCHAASHGVGECEALRMIKRSRAQEHLDRTAHFMRIDQVANFFSPMMHILKERLEDEEAALASAERFQRWAVQEEVGEVSADLAMGDITG